MVDTGNGISGGCECEHSEMGVFEHGAKNPMDHECFPQSCQFEAFPHGQPQVELKHSYKWTKPA